MKDPPSLQEPLKSLGYSSHLTPRYSAKAFRLVLGCILAAKTGGGREKIQQEVIEATFKFVRLELSARFRILEVRDNVTQQYTLSFFYFLIISTVGSVL